MTTDYSEQSSMLQSHVSLRFCILAGGSSSLGTGKHHFSLWYNVLPENEINHMLFFNLEIKVHIEKGSL